MQRSLFLFCTRGLLGASVVSWAPFDLPPSRPMRALQTGSYPGYHWFRFILAPGSAPEAPSVLQEQLEEEGGEEEREGDGGAWGRAALLRPPFVPDLLQIMKTR